MWEECRGIVFGKLALELRMLLPHVRKSDRALPHDALEDIAGTPDIEVRKILSQVKVDPPESPRPFLDEYAQS